MFEGGQQKDGIIHLFSLTLPEEHEFAKLQAAKDNKTFLMTPPETLECISDTM